MASQAESAGAECAIGTVPAGDAAPGAPPFAPHQPEAGLLPPGIVAQAADWLARLTGGPATSADTRACQAWRAADPRHELAWQRLTALDASLHPPQAGDTPRSRAAARQALETVARRQARRKLGGWTLGLAGAGVLAWPLRGHTPWPRLTADLRTATGEARALTLDDGTRLQLASASAVDLRYGATERLIVLQAGEVLVATGSDPAERPLRVATADGSALPLGTRFTVRRHDGPWPGGAGPATTVAVLDGQVRLQPLDAGEHHGLLLHAGQQAGIDRRGPVQPAAPADPGAGAWSDGMLVADRQRLDVFLAELARWRPGVLRCDPAVAPLRVTGSFPLADTDRVLAMLARVLPVRVVTRTRWWVAVLPA